MNFKQIIFLLSLLLGSAHSQQQEKYKITSTIGTYPLYFDNVYIININNSYGTLIEPPEGYKLLDVALGDSKLFTNELLNNRARIKRLAPDNPKSNAHIILMGPDNVKQSVTLELTGENSPKISTVKFVLPTNREANSQLEAMKSKYLEQMNAKLSEQERQMKKEVHENTIMDLQLFRFNSFPSKTSIEEFGAKVIIENIANSKGKGYVYMSTNANDPECQVVELTSIAGKGMNKHVRLFSSKFERGTTHYIYETSPFVKKEKKEKLIFNLKVYQKPVKIKATIL